MQFLTMLLKKIGVDRHVLSTMILRVWNIFIGLALMLVIPLKMTAVDQGFYYTIMSLASVQVFFELGFNYVLTQIVAHEAPYIDSSRDSFERVRNLVHLSKKWYTISSALFFFIGGAIGILVLKVTSDDYRIIGTWVTVLFFTSVNLYISPKLAIVEGLGCVSEVAKLRLKQSFLGYVSLIFFLFFGLGLPAMVCISFFASCIGVYWCTNNDSIRRFSSRHSEHCAQNINDINWKKDIFPFQWRIAVSWMSGYFIFQAMNPIVFYHQGAEVAGKLGLSLSVFNAITTLSMSWIYAKAPTFGTLISQQKFIESKKIFKIATLSSSMCNVFLCCIFIFAAYCIGLFYPQLTHRVLNLSCLTLLAICSLANQVIFSFAVYMRSFKNEPMMLNSIVTAVLTASGFYYFSTIDIYSALISYCFVTLGISLPWTLVLLKPYMKRNG